MGAMGVGKESRWVSRSRVALFLFVHSCVRVASAGDVPAVDEAPKADENVASPPVSSDPLKTPTEDATDPAVDAGGDAKKESAKGLFREGNALVHESFFRQAVEKYQAALALWDHPGIHYNLALALLNLDQPLEVREHLLFAIEKGESSVGEDKYRRAKEYLLLLDKQLSTLTLRCDHPGAQVYLDGEALFVGPSSKTIVLRPGQHAIRAAAPGFENTERALTLVAGQPADAQLKLYRPEDYIRYERRWDSWGPVALTATGAGVAILGGVLLWQGIDMVNTYDANVASQCQPNGCPPGKIEDTSASGNTLQGVGISALAVGGVAAATGGVLLYMNRPIPHRVDPESGIQLTFMPVLSPGLLGLSGRGTF